MVSCAVFAQKENNYAFYRNQMNLVNPAYAGVDGETMVSATYRKQWTGIKDAPETQAVAFGTSLNDNLGMGVTVINDKTFIEKQTFVGLDLSYRVRLSANGDLYLGVKAGGNFYNLDPTGLLGYDSGVVTYDPSIAMMNSFDPNIGIGALYKNRGYYLSLSVPMLLANEKAENDNNHVMVVTRRSHYYLSTGYDFSLSDAIMLKPSVMMRYRDGEDLSVDVNAMLDFYDKFQVGATYRTDKAYAALASVNLSKNFKVGFAYDMSTMKELASAKNTNEFLLQYKF